ncbi:hypothetical protein [Virgibacillus sp. 6R]|uniref:hypothetical protein n=1 Tax=Virgibacillus sp. 6R TaxID=1911587 RepID=UPI001E5EBABF|nr:hypothetical protein [Virgibacillus sp. 6R]
MTRILNIQKGGSFLSRADKECREVKQHNDQQNLVSVQLLLDVAVRDQFIERYGKNLVKKVSTRDYLATIELPENRFSFQFFSRIR